MTLGPNPKQLKSVLAALALICGPLCSSPARAQVSPVDIHLWVKAFVPNSHPSNPGYIQPVPGSPGKFMFPGPTIPWTNMPIPWIGSCYNTNDRTFSSAPDADAKLTTGARFSTDGATISGFAPEKPPSAHTLEYDCPSGRVTCDLAPDISGLAVDAPVATAGRVRVRMQGRGKNPCVHVPAGATPAIEYDLNLEVDPATGYASVKGTIGQFPAFEAYARVGSWPVATLLNEAPAPGSTAWALSYPPRNVDREVRYAKLDGTWTSNDPNSRFKLTVNGDQVQWAEKAATGQTLVRTTTLARQPGKGYRLERANDAAVLTFLGLSPSIQSAVQAAGPQPSFLMLRVDGDRLAGQWNGLLVIKDNQAHFKELKQPGTTPPKAYTFIKQ